MACRSRPYVHHHIHDKYIALAEGMPREISPQKQVDENDKEKAEKHVEEYGHCCQVHP